MGSRRLFLLQAILLACLALDAQARSTPKVAQKGVAADAQPEALQAHKIADGHWQPASSISPQRLLQGFASESLASGIAQGTLSTGGGGGNAQLNYNPGAGRRLQHHAAHLSSALTSRQAA
ncbi:g11018 [Coccomyxa viridis]|uniref:G11018 protein n=1 Tax=Coccomyxa viridis TaxID=1274662 RepID=A0ABP1G6W0_9CHLO